MSSSGFAGQGDAWEQHLVQQDLEKRVGHQEFTGPKDPPKKRDDPEHREAVALMRVVDLHLGRYPALKWFHHQDNGRSTKAQNGRKKAEGVRLGVADYFLAFASRKQDWFAGPMHVYYGLYIELKAPGQVATLDQLEFLSDMRDQGYAAEWTDGADKAWLILESYLKHTYKPRPL